MQTHGIEYEPLALYSQEENSILEKKKWMLIEWVWSTILEKDIPDNF